MTGYVREGDCVEVFEHLTVDQFRRVGVLMGQPLGRYKDFSNHYVFDFGPGCKLQADELCKYLRRIGKEHTRDVTSRWARPEHPHDHGDYSDVQ